MQEEGAQISLLAGSGASIFGVFESGEDRDRAGAALAGMGFTTWAAETLQRLPEPRLQAATPG